MNYHLQKSCLETSDFTQLFLKSSPGGLYRSLCFKIKRDDLIEESRRFFILYVINFILNLAIPRVIIKSNQSLS